MKYAICILAHNKPDLLGKLVESVRANNTEIIIHLDAKADIGSFSNIPDAVFIPDRVRVHWGGRSMVVAMYRLIRYAVRHTDCDYLIFVSGQDLPLVSPAEYRRFIDPEKNYLTYHPLPWDNWYMGGLDRIQYYYFFSTSSSLMSRALVKLQKMTGFRRNYEKQGIFPYGGSQWININREAAQLILDQWSDYYRFFRYTHIPDELIFQTILASSGLQHTLINSNLRYLTFDNDDGYHPSYLDERHVVDIKESEAIFCRKIRSVTDFDKIRGLLQSQ